MSKSQRSKTLFCSFFLFIYFLWNFSFQKIFCSFLRTRNVHIGQWSFASCFTDSCSFSGARGQREALEASVSGLDGEGPLNIWEHAADEGSLVQPSAYLPFASHQVPVLFYYNCFKSGGNSLVRQEQLVYSCIPRLKCHGLRSRLFSNGPMCSAKLLSSPFQVLAKDDGQKHTRSVMDEAIWPRCRSRSTEKAESSISWDIYLSVQTWGLGRSTQLLLQAGKDEIVALSWTCWCVSSAPPVWGFWRSHSW